MRRWVIDTNVPIVANDRPDPGRGGRRAAAQCVLACTEFLEDVLRNGRVVLDGAGAIEGEYARKLDPRGQPGVGDLFYQQVLRSAPRIVERVDLSKRGDGEYLDLPQQLIDAGFDRSDRKFAALAKREGAPVVNSTDSDWLEHLGELRKSGIEVRFLCGEDQAEWFAA